MLIWLSRKYAIWGFRKKCLLDKGIKTVIKEYITACIIERKQEGRRQELLDIQKEIKEIDLFAKFLKSIK